MSAAALPRQRWISFLSMPPRFAFLRQYWRYYAIIE